MSRRNGKSVHTRGGADLLGIPGKPQGWPALSPAFGEAWGTNRRGRGLRKPGFGLLGRGLRQMAPKSPFLAWIPGTWAPGLPGFGKLGWDARFAWRGGEPAYKPEIRREHARKGEIAS
jgi:hypothetical protein